MAALTGFLFPANTTDRAPYLPEWLDAPIPFEPVVRAELREPFGMGPSSVPIPLVEPRYNFSGSVEPSFSLELYNRILIEPSQINAGNVVSEQLRTVSIFNGFFSGVTINSILAANAVGIGLEGITAPAALGPLATKIVTFRIGTEGPPEIDALFQFTFDTYTPLTVAITGSRVIALPYQVEAGFKETLEWRTEVLTSNNGKEQRIQHRFKPRQKFSGTYHVPSNEVARADNILYGWIGQRWAVPVWSESQFVGGLHSTNIIPCATGTTDIRIGGLVLLWETPRKFEVIEVDDVGFSSVTLARPVNNSYVRALLMPLRSGLGGASASAKKSGHTGKINMSFDILDNIQLPSANPPQFLGEDIYYEPSLLGDEGFTDKFHTKVDRVDYGGVVETYLPWQNKKIGRTTYFVLKDAAEVWSFRKWLHRRAGKLRPYWLPTFEDNLRLTMVGPVASSLIVLADDFKGLADARIHIAVQFTDNTWALRTIIGSSAVDEATTAIAINSPLSTDAANIKMISYLGLKRLDTDSVSIEWIGGGVATCSMGILEIAP